MTSFKVNKVGIALAAYQPKIDFFVEQLRSIQAQTFEEWVCVITFDSPLAEVLVDSRIRSLKEDHRFVFLENRERLGPKKNFERAIQLALNYGVDAIACSDQDDIWYPEKLKVSVDELNRVGRGSLIHCDMHLLVDGEVHEKTGWDIERRGIYNTKTKHLLVRNVVSGCAMLFDVELARKFPVIPDEVEFHDHWYALVASKHGGVYPIDQPLYLYRQHGANEVGVSPFVGRFAMQQKLGFVKIVKKCQKGWIKSKALATALKKTGLVLSICEKLIFLRQIDLGFGLFLMSSMNYFGDPPLARAAFIRAIGKFVKAMPFTCK